MLYFQNGTLEIYDINSQQLLEKVESHDSAVNCICEHPNQVQGPSFSFIYLKQIAKLHSNNEEFLNLYF